MVALPKWLRWGGGDDKAALRAELENLRDEVRGLKSAAPNELVAGVAGRGGAFAGQPNLGNHREQLLHFRGWVFVCVRAIASRVAGAEISIARKPAGVPRTKAVGNDLVPLPSHPLLEAIEDPNDLMCTWQLIFILVASLELTGKAYWWLRTEDDGGLEIWPLPAHWVTPDHTAGLYANWIVRPPGNPEGFTVAGEDMAYFNLPDPADPIMGAVSPVQSQSRAIAADEAIQDSQQVAFSNGIFPRVILKAGRLTTPDGNLSDRRPVLTPEQRSQLIEAIRNAWGGVMRNGDTAIVDGLIEEIVKLSNSPHEMDYLDSGTSTKNRIFQAFGVNPLIVGEIQGANRAQAVVAEDSFLSNVVNPLLKLLGQILTAWVAPRFPDGDSLVVWFEPLTARDDELELKKFMAGRKQGDITTNEYRRRILNLPDVPWGDEQPKPQPGPIGFPGGGGNSDGGDGEPKATRFLIPGLNPYTLKELASNAHEGN